MYNLVTCGHSPPRASSLLSKSLWYEVRGILYLVRVEATVIHTHAARAPRGEEEEEEEEEQEEAHKYIYTHAHAHILTHTHTHIY